MGAADVTKGLQRQNGFQSTTPHFFAALLKQVIAATAKLVKSVLTNPPCHRPIRLSEKLKRLQAENSPIMEVLPAVLRPVGS